MYTLSTMKKMFEEDIKTWVWTTHTRMLHRNSWSRQLINYNYYFNPEQIYGTFNGTLERRVDSSENAPEWDIVLSIFSPLRRPCMARERPVLQNLIGCHMVPPISRRSPAPIRRLYFSYSAAHWRTWTDDELILVKYSCACDELKIGGYIKRVVETRQAPLLLWSAVRAAAAPPPRRG